MIINDFPWTPYHKGYESRKIAPYFVAWDGEGITPTGQAKQNYVLFGNSLGYAIKSEKLTTKECLDLVIETERDNPNAIHVGFAFGYDVEMILCDLAPDRMRILKQKGYVTWKSYRLEYRKSKYFQITYLGSKRITARIWDVWSFFSTSFVKAIEDYLGNVDHLNVIRSGKDERRYFTYDEIDNMIRPYWELELKYTVDIMNSLRERLISADLPIKQWHGPGAIATYALNKYKVSSVMAVPPENVSDASQHAYAGGRFELFRMGRANSKVWAYDIRSAYPSAIRMLPNLSSGQWRYVNRPDSISDFGVYHVTFRHGTLFSLRPFPLFYRDNRHAIHYPNIVEGWYWSPEAKIIHGMKDAEVIEGYEFIGDGERPFEWVNDIYEQRAEWKRENNPAQIALKLLLNSMYGKFAQRVGWQKTGTAPKWHQLEYAGWVTSHARAQLFNAMVHAWSTDSLLGVETDGIFTTSPLPLDIGPGLGQWEETTYDDIIYLQSGFYHKLIDGEWHSKVRGFDKNSVTIENTIKTISEWEPWTGKGEIIGQTTRFATMGLWLASNSDIRNVWTTKDRRLALGNDGKRIHRKEVCRACRAQATANEMMHDLTVTFPHGGISRKHILPWLSAEINPFRELEEFDYNA